MMKILINSSVVDETGYKICKYSIPNKKSVYLNITYIFDQPLHYSHASCYTSALITYLEGFFES